MFWVVYNSSRDLAYYVIQCGARYIVLRVRVNQINNLMKKLWQRA